MLALILRVIFFYSLYMFLRSFFVGKNRKVRQPLQGDKRDPRNRTNNPPNKAQTDIIEAEYRVIKEDGKNHNSQSSSL